MLVTLEIGIVFGAIFALASGGVPGVNESHYLTKAKNFWNPDWCRGDLFLESADAHYVFFLVAGWPSRFISLESFAWSGRLFCWLGAAIVWVKLNRALGIKPGLAPFTVVLFILLTERFDLAGEWIIGGFEAKSIAYVFVLWSVELFIRRQMQWFWPVLGLACAFHAVIGIWATVCFLGSWTISRNFLPASAHSGKTSGRSTRLFPFISFVVLLLAGIVPPLISNAGESTTLIRHANEIQVHYRLTHHLLFSSFPTSNIARFTVLVALWLTLTRLVRWNHDFRRLHWFSAMSLAISISGLLLSAMAESAGTAAAFADSMLRFYWFRLSDFAVPLGLSLIVGRLAQSLLDSRQSTRRCMVIVCGSLVVVAALIHARKLRVDSRSPADAAVLPNYPDDPMRTEQTAENWKNACLWIREHAPPDALFITPLSQQTFKWYAQRAEAVCWKDAPQDATGIVEWCRRYNSLRDIENLVPAGFLGLTSEQRINMASSFSATHVIIPQSLEDAARGGSGVENRADDLKRVYPLQPDDRTTYVVYELSNVFEQIDEEN